MMLCKKNLKNISLILFYFLGFLVGNKRTLEMSKKNILKNQQHA